MSVSGVVIGLLCMIKPSSYFTYTTYAGMQSIWLTFHYDKRSSPRRKGVFHALFKNKKTMRCPNVSRAPTLAKSFSLPYPLPGNPEEHLDMKPVLPGRLLFLTHGVSVGCVSLPSHLNLLLPSLLRMGCYFRGELIG